MLSAPFHVRALSQGWLAGELEQQCTLCCLLLAEHFPLPELLLGKGHRVGHGSHAALAPFWPWCSVHEAAVIAVLRIPQDTLSSKLCVLAGHTCVPGPGSGQCQLLHVLSGQAGAVCFVAAGPEQASAAASAGAR